MPGRPPYRRANAAGAAYIASLAPTAWYRWGIGITSASDLVSAWADQSGNGYHLVQATETNKPTLQADSTIRFDGADNYMDVAVTQTQPLTIAMRFKELSTTANDTFIDQYEAANFVAIYRITSPDVYIEQYATQTGARGVLAVNTWGSLVCVFDNPGGVMRINGTETTGDPWVGATADSDGITLGARNDLANYAHMDVREVIYFAGALTAAQRIQVGNYLDTL